MGGAEGLSESRVGGRGVGAREHGAGGLLLSGEGTEDDLQVGVTIRLLRGHIPGPSSGESCDLALTASPCVSVCFRPYVYVYLSS